MILLRNYKHSDVGILASLANNYEVSRFLRDTFPYPYTEEDAVWWIEVGSKESGAVTQVIESDGVFVGTIGIMPLQGWRSHVAEIGYWIGRPYWGKGIATMAVELMTEMAFQELGFLKLIAPVLGPNMASIRVLEKNGYDCEGILKNEVYRNNQYYDLYRFAKHG